MRLSCNGCRILRKGCSDNCTIRPCLQWINSPESQANATLFLAKFYGRAGLLNLINAAPQHLRPAVFQSLLYESCGRIVNPVYGSMGLFWTGEWARCQAAVDAVLTGMEIGNGVEVSDWQGKETAATHGSDHVLAACDIRHVSTESHVEKEKGDVNKVKGRARFKTGGEGPKGRGGEKVKVIKPKPRVGWVDSLALLRKPVPDHLSESESMFSGETVEASLMNRDEPERERGENNENRADEPGLDLDLTLGYGDLIR